MPKHSDGGRSGRKSDPRPAARHEAKWTSEEYRFGPFVLRTDRRELKCEDVVRPMERRCFDLLVYLLHHAGRVVSKDELLDHVWSNRFVTMSVIAQSVLKVRKALRLPSGQEGPLRTVHRVGYRIAGEVQHRRLAPTELQARSNASTWQWDIPRLNGMPDAPDWLSPALGAFGALALHSNGISVLQDVSLQGPHATPLASCEVEPSPLGFSACVDLQLDQEPQVRLTATSPSPFKAVWQAAESAAWLLRLRELMEGTTRGPAEWRWERLATLSHSAPPVIGVQGPMLSAIWEAQLERSPLDQQADLLLEAAWRGDPAAGRMAEQLGRSARREHDTQAQVWAELGAAMARWQSARYGLPDLVQAVRQCFAHLEAHGPDANALRANAVAGHLLFAAGAVHEAPPTWRALAVQDLSPHSSAWRWRLLAELQWRLGQDGGADLAGAERLDAWVQASSLGDGLQALLQNLCGLLRAEDGELDQAWQRLKRASDLAQHSAWVSVRPLCLLSLGELSARLGDRATLTHCLAVLAAETDRDAPRMLAVRDWLQARQLRMDEQHHAALGLIEQALPVLQTCGGWFPEDAWLMAIDTALHVRSRASLVQWRRLLGERDHAHGRARSATLAVLDAALARLDGERQRARQLVVQAWRGAPPSTAKRLLAMAAASALRWVPNESGDLLAQAMAQAGPWLHQSAPGRRLRDGTAYRAPAVVIQGVAEPDLDPLWHWAA